MSVALVNRHVMRQHHVLLSRVACPEVPYFSTVSYERYDFLGGKNYLT